MVQGVGYTSYVHDKNRMWGDVRASFLHVYSDQNSGCLLLPSSISGLSFFVCFFHQVDATQWVGLGLRWGWGC